MRCLYCGTEYWLPAHVRRDPDFCSPDHREKYNHRVGLALRYVQESSTQPLANPPSAPVAPGSPSITDRPQEKANPVLRPEAFRDPKPVNIPQLKTRPIFERLEQENPASHAQDAREPEFTQIFSVPETPSLIRGKVGRYAGAAAVVGIALWFAPDAARLARDLFNSCRELASRAIASNAPAPAPSMPSLPVRSEPVGFRHPVAWLRGVASKRATLRLAENFDHGMAAWGDQLQGWAPGWTRSPDGYVRPGRLALFQPSVGYADYRMEFFGQIENNSMSWVVRGKDTQNYYAMKVNLLRPGLRPVLSLTHYPVVQGRQGHLVQLPLSVMIHNGMPYHVSVEVNGSHYTASIEGEEVDSWSDDTLQAGGVGFFADSGERARIYWLRVSRNDDWLGRLCGQIAAPGNVGATARFARPASILPVPATVFGFPIAFN